MKEIPTRVLLVEDNPVDIHLFEDMLRAESIAMEHLDRIDSAIARLRKGHVDVVLLDLVLPDSQGLESFRRIHAVVPQIPIIVLTGFDDEDLATQAVSEGAQDYLVKGQASSNLLVRAIRYAIERKRGEEAIRMLAKAVETMQLGVTITDTKGVILFANPAECEMHGYASGELTGREVRILSPRELWNPMNTEQVRTMSSWQRESMNVRKDGSSFQVRLLSDLVLNAAGQPIGIITTCEDITERKSVEEAHRQSEEKYRTIIETIEDGYYEVNLNGEFTFFNDSLCRIFGYPSESLIHTNHRNYMDEGNASKSYQIFNLVLNTGSPARALECQIIRKDSAKRDVEFSVSLVRDSKGHPVGFRGIVRDITERKAAERLVLEQTKIAERAKALERSNRELERFAYVTSHDLQEPLRKIQAFADRLKAKYVETIPEEGLDYLERMTNASKRMQMMINDLLTFARVTTKIQPFSRVDLNRLTREVLADLELRIERTGGRVELSDLFVIDGDPTQIRQLLQNLIGNALKFHRENVPPVVKIYGNLLKHPGNGDPEACQIIVEDNGIGFEEKYLDRIFLPFSRLHGRIQYEGTGIGLAICSKIAERHSGSITASSAPSQGSKFVVTLPVKHR